MPGRGLSWVVVNVGAKIMTRRGLSWMVVGGYPPNLISFFSLCRN